MPSLHIVSVCIIIIIIIVCYQRKADDILRRGKQGNRNTSDVLARN